MTAPVRPPVDRDLTHCAPALQILVLAALAECAKQGFDAFVYETCRSEALQQWYFAHGASKARTAVHSWHIYGLAVDVISTSHDWAAWDNAAWKAGVSGIFKSHGLAWGGDWHSFHDWPHFELGSLSPSPSIADILLFNAEGKEAVWRKYGAT